MTNVFQKKQKLMYKYCIIKIFSINIMKQGTLHTPLLQITETNQ